MLVLEREFSKIPGTLPIVTALIKKPAGSDTITIRKAISSHLATRHRRPLSSKKIGLADMIRLSTVSILSTLIKL